MESTGILKHEETVVRLHSGLLIADIIIEISYNTYETTACVYGENNNIAIYI